MTLQIAKQVFGKIEDSRIAELKIDLYRAAEKYTCCRTAWRLTPPEHRHLIDASRTRSHNALIDALNTLSREQANLGEDNSWRGTLGDDRKTLGDIAAYIVLFLALTAR
ncbi:MAG: hypothetical protein SFY81_08360 [Verrucomicrobiota bacterium]|nr:hypothetical protein [Verrucomicrobiota bacterium]